MKNFAPGASEKLSNIEADDTLDASVKASKEQQTYRTKMSTANAKSGAQGTKFRMSVSITHKREGACLGWY